MGNNTQSKVNLDVPFIPHSSHLFTTRRKNEEFAEFTKAKSITVDANPLNTESSKYPSSNPTSDNELKFESKIVRIVSPQLVKSEHKRKRFKNKSRKLEKKEWTYAKTVCTETSANDLLQDLDKNWMYLTYTEENRRVSFKGIFEEKKSSREFIYKRSMFDKGEFKSVKVRSASTSIGKVKNKRRRKSELILKGIYK